MLTHERVQDIARAFRHFDQRRSQVIFAPTHGGHGCFDGYGVNFAEQRVYERQVAKLKLGGTRDIARKEACAYLVGLARHDIGEHGDTADTAKRNHLCS